LIEPGESVQDSRIGPATETAGAVSQQQFDGTVGEVTSSLGDPTRRAIYLTVRDADGAKSVVEVAELFGLHPNVARYHLDHLVQSGYLRVKRVSTGPGAGRPAHLYESTGREIHVDLPSQSFELLARMLLRVLQRIGSVDGAELAYLVGLSHGEELAANLRVPGAADLAAVVEAAAERMRGLGFRISTEGSECGYQTTHCPFGKVALDNPRVVCALDRGLVTGLMSALGQPADVTVAPHTRLTERCTTLVLAPNH
jgi:predicted ArsR family transcriptional regulator